MRILLFVLASLFWASTALGQSVASDIRITRYPNHEQCLSHATDCTTLTCASYSPGRCCVEEDSDTLYFCDGPAATWLSVVATASLTGAVIVVASNDATQAQKDAADFVCDGTNDEVQIQAAIDDLLDGTISSIGGTVLLTQGAFSLCKASGTAHVSITGGGITIRGMGVDATRLNSCTSQERDTFEADISSDNEWLTIEHLLADGEKDNNTVGSFFYDSKGAGEIRDVHMEHLFLTDFPEATIEFEDAWGLIVDSVIIEFGEAEAIKINGGDDWKVLNSKIISNEGSAVAVSGTSAKGHIHNNLLRCDSSSALCNVISLGGTGGQTIVSGNVIVGNPDATFSADGINIASNNNVVSNNIFDGDLTDAIDISADRLTGVGNYFTGNGVTINDSGSANQFCYRNKSNALTHCSGPWSFDSTTVPADPADSGALRFDNAETVCWEASPAGTDQCITINSSEQLTTTGVIAPGGNIVMGDSSVTGIDTLTFTDTAGTVAGIQNQNLVDKTAAESISGAYTFTGAFVIEGNTDTNLFRIVGAEDSVTIGSATSTQAKLFVKGTDTTKEVVRFTAPTSQTGDIMLLKLSGTGDVASIDASGLISTLVGLDAIGNVDMDYGSADVDDHTFIADGGTVVIDGTITPGGNIIMADNSVTGIDTLTFTDTAGTIAGVENQNLLDKTATESISGAYTFTVEMTADDLGIEFTAGDAITNCSTFSATGGGIFFDDSEGIFKKCQDNTLTDLDTSGAVRLDEISDPTGDTSITATDGEDVTLVTTHTSGDTNFLTLDANQTDDAAATDDFDVMRIEMLSESGDAGDTFEGLVISQETGTANTVIDAAIRIENLENLADTMTSAIQIECTTANAITTALDVSDAEIRTAIDIGANDFVTAAATLASTELDRLDGLAGVIVTDATAVTNLEGQSLDIDSATLRVTPDSIDDAQVVDGGLDATSLGTDSVSADELNATGVEAELEAVLDINELQGTIAAGQYAADSIDGDDMSAEQDRRIKCAVIETPVALDEFMIFRTETAITVTGMDCISEDATSAVITLEECDADGDSCGTVEAITCAVTNTADDGIDDSAIAAAIWMRMVVGTVTGTPDHVTMCFHYTVDS